MPSPAVTGLALVAQAYKAMPKREKQYMEALAEMILDGHNAAEAFKQVLTAYLGERAVQELLKRSPGR